MDNNKPEFLQDNGGEPTPPSGHEEQHNLSLDELLHDTGGNGRMRIIFIAGGVLIVIILIWFVISFFNKPSSPPATNENQNSITYNDGIQPGGVEDTVRLGTTIPDNPSQSTQIGLTDQSPIPISKQSEYISTLRELRNLLLVDIVALAKDAPNRADTLDNYEASLRSIANKSADVKSTLLSQKDMLTSEISRVDTEKSDQKQQYQTSLTTYDGNEAMAALEKFIASQKYESELYTLSKHIESLASLSGTLLQVTDRKLTFLKANREALLHNIEVVDISGIKEDLSKSEAEWKASLGN